MSNNVLLETETPFSMRTLELNGLESPLVARAILKVQFSATAKRRMRELSAKARAGELSPAEEIEIENFERFGCVLDILHSRARRALDRRKKASS